MGSTKIHAADNRAVIEVHCQYLNTVLSIKLILIILITTVSYFLCPYGHNLWFLFTHFCASHIHSNTEQCSRHTVLSCERTEFQKGGDIAKVPY